MLIKIRDNIINTSHIVEAKFGAAPNDRRPQLTLVFSNHSGVSTAGTMTLQGDEAKKVWDVLSREAVDVSP